MQICGSSNLIASVHNRTLVIDVLCSSRGYQMPPYDHEDLAAKVALQQKESSPETNSAE